MLESGDTLGRYRIVDLIGSGGMGEVYLAEDTELQRRVAVKLFTLEVDEGAARDHLLHEARAASALSHPNVCTVFEVGEHNGRPFIVMEYVEGRTLDALIASRDLPTERVVRYGSQIADAVAHAHNHGVIHRDLKSANVVITTDGRAKVLDFGLASTVASKAGGATREVTSTEAGRMSGTLSYMAPEVLRGREADQRSDVWALGVVLYEAATGRLPFRGDTAFEVSTAIMKDSAEIPAETSPGLKAVIQHCLQKAPGERYQSAAEVRAALEMLQSGGTTSNEAIAAEVAAATTAAGGPNWTAIAAGFSVVAVLGLGAWMMLGRPSAPTPRTPDGIDHTTASGLAIGASGRPTIAVLPFRDRTGAEEMTWMAEGIPSMLVTGLAQTPGLDVVGNSRVREIVTRLGVENLRDNDAAALSDFGARSGAGAVIVGDLYYTGTEYRIEAQVEDINTGRVLNAYSVTGPFVFGLVDDLVAQIRAGLEVDAPESGERLADVTTGSLDAWRAYDEGVRLRSNLAPGRALARFEEAIAIDPDFVLAKFQAAGLRRSMEDPAKADEYDAFVKANIDRVPERDRPYVEASYLFRDNDLPGARALLEDLVARYPDHELAWFALYTAYSAGLLGFSEEQVEALERGVAAIPASGMLHNQLGYAYMDQGRYTEAVRAIEKYIELNPEEVNAYDSLAEMYTVSGQPQLGFEKYTETLDVDPTWVFGYLGRAMTLGMMGRYTEAFDELEKYQEAWIAASPNPVSDYPLVRGMMLAKLGRYGEAIELVRDTRPLATARNDALSEVSLDMIGIVIAFEAEDSSSVHVFAAQMLASADSVEIPEARSGVRLFSRIYPALADIGSGDFTVVRRTLAELRDAAAESGDTDLRSATEMVAAELALAEGDLDAAEQAFEKQLPEVKAFYSLGALPPTLMANNNPSRDGIGRVQVARGDLDGAIATYRDLITVNLGSRYNAFVDPRYVLRLAEVLDEAGQTDEARRQYLRFVEFWADADAQFQPTVEQARARAAELGG